MTFCLCLWGFTIPLFQCSQMYTVSSCSVLNSVGFKYSFAFHSQHVTALVIQIPPTLFVLQPLELGLARMATQSLWLRETEEMVTSNAHERAPSSAVTASQA